MNTETRIAIPVGGSLPTINALIAQSKSHWPWPTDYLQAALPLHRLSEAYLRVNACRVVLDPLEEPVAFGSLAITSGRMYLDNLWVRPAWMGRQLGRRLGEELLSIARTGGESRVWVLPDPPAEGFYRKLGFVDTGERVLSRVPSGPLFSLLRLDL